MSFIEQERALFDLLFDKQLRDAFISDGNTSLVEYELDQDELGDFKTIRPDALEIDCNIRINLVLSQVCRAYPVSFTLLSSIPDGFEQLKILVNPALMKTPHTDRNSHFGESLLNNANSFNISDESLRAKIFAYVATERGMAISASLLKEDVINGKYNLDSVENASDEQMEKPTSLAPFVSASLLPSSYMTIKKDICKVRESSLWRYLSKTPLDKKEFARVLSNDDPRLLVTRAYVTSHSNFDPVIDQKTIELPEGFSFLFQYIDGNFSINHILEQMKQTGAEEKMLKSIQSAFIQLIELGVLRFE
jgi:hypothetical protein